MKIDGGCHCGALAYEAEADPRDVTICHCTDCQKVSGTAFRTVVQIKAEQFRMVRGEPVLYVKRGESGAERPQAFCATCGSQIYGTGVGAAASMIGVRVGTCNQRADLVPQRQIWRRSALSWLGDLDTQESSDLG